MKKVLISCLVLTALCCSMVYAAAKDVKNVDVVNVLHYDAQNASELKLQIQVIEAQLAENSLRGIESPDLKARLAELYAQVEPTGRTGSRTLDQGGEDCANAFVIASAPFSDTGTYGLTDDCVGRPYFDVFYTYTTVYAGNHIFDMCGSDGDSYFKIWTAGTCCSGTSTTGDDECGGADPQRTINFAAGVVLFIECGNYYSSMTDVNYIFNLQAPAPPAPYRCCYGDPCNPSCADMYEADCVALGGTWTSGVNCATSPCAVPLPGDLYCNALPVPGLPFTASGNTCSYTNNYDAVCPYTGGTAPDVVYTYTPTVDQQVTFSLCLSGFDTKLYIYDGAPVPGGEIACNDDASPCPGSTGSYRSYLECVQLFAGHSYVIVVDGYGTACGDYVLTMDACQVCDVVCPPNGTPEGEPICQDGDVDTYNAGCNDPVAFSALPLPCGVELCGTSGTFLFDGLNYRDTDWFVFTVTDDLDSNVFCLTAEFNAYFFLFPMASCADINGGVVEPIVVMPAAPCVPICYTNCLPAGDYIAVVLPQGFTGVPCGAEYVLTRTCTPCSEPFVCQCDIHPNTHCEYAVDNTTYPINNLIPTTYVTINVPIEYQITDLNVCLDINHTWVSDLDITLTSPMGTVIDLSLANGGSGDNFTCTTFDDEAGTPIGSGTAPFTGSFQPDSPLSAVDGENAVGAWVLAVTDYWGGDDGWLNWVCLTFEYDIILPVNFGSFDAVAGDRQVTLNWNTLSENNVHHFDVIRDGSKVAEVAATNSATGSEYRYVDGSLTNGTIYSYSLVSVDVNGARQELASVEATPNAGAAVITEYALHQNYPNPFNPTTNIAFDLVDAGLVKISVYNVMGQKVSELVNGSFEAGRHVVSFDATGLSSGLYLYKMEANGFTAQAKMVLMK